jgi:hypothetical protein
MITETFFNIADASEIETSSRKIKKISTLIILIGVPVELLIAYLASRKYSNLFWPVFIGGSLLLLLAYYFVFVKGLKRFKQDLNEQIKLVGEAKVISKSDKDKLYIIRLESPNFESLYVTKNTFDKINIGQPLYVEVSKYANHIFKLSQNGETLLGS